MGFADDRLKGFMSKKLLCFLTSTLLLVFDKIDAQSWTIIAGIYVGTQGAIDLIKSRIGR